MRILIAWHVLFVIRTRVLSKIFISSFSTSFTSNYILRVLIARHEFWIFIFFCLIWTLERDFFCSIPAKCNHFEMNYKCICCNLTCFLLVSCLAHSILKFFSNPTIMINLQKLFIPSNLKLSFLWENYYATIKFLLKIMLLSFTCCFLLFGQNPSLYIYERERERERERL